MTTPLTRAALTRDGWNFLKPPKRSDASPARSHETSDSWDKLSDKVSDSYSFVGSKPPTPRKQSPTRAATAEKTSSSSTAPQLSNKEKKQQARLAKEQAAKERMAKAKERKAVEDALLGKK